MRKIPINFTINLKKREVSWSKIGEKEVTSRIEDLLGVEEDLLS